MMGRFLRTGSVWVRHDNAEPFGSPKRICPGKSETPQNLKNLGGTLVKPWWNFGGTLVAPSAEPFGQPKMDLPQRHHETWRTLVEPWWNLRGTLVEPWRNLGGTFRGTCWRPKTDLPQRTIESPKAILPWNLYYGWRFKGRMRWRPLTRETVKVETVLMGDTLLGTNISPTKALVKMIFLFPRWDMLVQGGYSFLPMEERALMTEILHDFRYQYVHHILYTHIHIYIYSIHIIIYT